MMKFCVICSPDNDILLSSIQQDTFNEHQPTLLQIFYMILTQSVKPYGSQDAAE